MKFLILIISLLSLSAQAYNCPGYLQSNKQAQKSYQWLLPFVGSHPLNGCHVEVTLCETGAKLNDGAPIGEVLISTIDGRQAYVSLDFPVQRTPKFKTKVKTYKRAYTFLKKDRYYENVNGRTEVWRLEFNTEWGNTKSLETVSLGIYTTNSDLNQPNGNDSLWYVCNSLNH